MKTKIKSLKLKPKHIVKIKEFLDNEYEIANDSKQPESLGDKVGGFNGTTDKTVKSSHQFNNNWARMGVNVQAYNLYEEEPLKEDKVLFKVKVEDLYKPISKDEKAKFKIKKLEFKDGELIKKAVEVKDIKFLSEI